MKILIGAPVKQDEVVFRYYLKSLDTLDKGDHEVDYYFILHNSPELKQYLKEDQYEEYTNQTTYEVADTHIWKDDNLRDVVKMKNKLLQLAVERGYDYFMLVDSDLILHKNTLLHLLDQQKDIIGNIFWTRWETQQKEMPNAWYYDYYGFESHEQIEALYQKQITKVGYTGACILIKSNVINSGVNYSPINNISWTNWEDRAFCIRAKVHGYDIWLSTYYRGIHLYRGEEVRQYESRGYK